MGRTLQKQDRGAKQREKTTPSQGAKFRTLEIKVRILIPKGGNFAHLNPRCEMISRCENHYPKCEIPSWHTSAIFAHFKPNSHVQNKVRNFAQCEICEIDFKCRYPTRRPPTDPVSPADQARRPASRPPAKKTKVSAPGEPSHAPQAEPPTEESGFLWRFLSRPFQASMIAGPPIEGNLDCRARSFHSEIYFDIEALRQQQSSETHSDCCRGITWSIFSLLGNSIIPE
ncbi:hypothetical protein CK203_039460 [Vitis vinifera]|uniref:Uncharacterized protein n=1 Tax=Vitis vinifera TaxID=29760 RepID=A0A438I7B6_VITVI|nr:hypothetical protein CK203_039460 [Vitis vinifera]